FFSSRRRHTSSKRDWSSDVCSSDLGYNRRQFKMLKFRTMVPEAELLQPFLEHLNVAQGPVFKIKKDPRITPIGRIMRRTSLDERSEERRVGKEGSSEIGTEQ